MTECVTIGNATLYHGDCLAILPELPVFDALITDPPYSSGGFTRGDRALTSTVAKYVQSDAVQVAHNQDFSGDNRDARSWGYWMTLWIGAAQERMRQGAYALMFVDWRQLPMLTDIFQAGGLVWRGIAPWDKTECARAPHPGYLRHQCEYIVWGSNGPLAATEHGGPWPGLYRQAVNHREKLHMTAKPVSLMGDLCRIPPPGSLIVDPFMGSASTGVAAVQLGHRFIGIEKNRHYFDVACRRMAEVQATLFEPGAQQLDLMGV